MDWGYVPEDTTGGPISEPHSLRHSTNPAIAADQAAIPTFDQCMYVDKVWDGAALQETRCAERWFAFRRGAHGRVWAFCIEHLRTVGASRFRVGTGGKRWVYRDGRGLPSAVGRVIQR